LTLVVIAGIYQIGEILVVASQQPKLALLRETKKNPEHLFEEYKFTEGAQ